MRQEANMIGRFDDVVSYAAQIANHNSVSLWGFNLENFINIIYLKRFIVCFQFYVKILANPAIGIIDPLKNPKKILN